MHPKRWVILIASFAVFGGSVAPLFAAGDSDFTIDQIAGSWSYRGVMLPFTQCRWNESGTLILNDRGAGTLENRETGVGAGSGGNPCPVTSADFEARLTSFTSDGTAVLSLIRAGQTGIATGLNISLSSDRKTMTLTGSGEWYGFQATAFRKP